MLLAIKNTFATLENKVRADRILLFVKSFVPLLLFGQKHHCAVVSGLILVIVDNGVSDVTPHIRGIITVQVDYTFLL